MIVCVRLFAAARQLAGTELLQVEVQEPATIASLRSAMEEAVPALQGLLAHARFAVNARYTFDDHPIASHDEIACIPPVSGG